MYQETQQTNVLVQALKQLENNLVESNTLSEVSDTFLQFLSHQRNVLGGSIYLVDNQTEALNCTASLNSRFSDNSELLSQVLLSALKSKQIQRHDLLKEMGVYVAAVPILFEEEALGLVVIEVENQEFVTGSELEILQLYIKRLASALKNLQDTRNFTSELRRTEALHDISLMLAKPDANIDETFQEVLEHLQKVMAVDLASLFEYLPRDGKLHMRAWVGELENKKEFLDSIRVLSPTVGAMGWAFRNKKLRNIPDVKKDEYYYNIREDLHSKLTVPLIIGERPVGAINLESVRPDRFSREDEQFVETIAGQLATALNNMRFMSDRLLDIEVLKEIATQLASSLTFQSDDLLKLLWEQLGRIVDNKNMYFGLIDEDELHFRAACINGEFFSHEQLLNNSKQPQNDSSSISVSDFIWEPYRLDKLPLLLKKIVETKASFLVTEGFEHKVAQLVEEPTIRTQKILNCNQLPKSWLAVPILYSRNSLAGIIVLQNFEREHAFDQIHEDVLRTVGNFMGIALENIAAYSFEKGWASLGYTAGGMLHITGNQLGIIPFHLEEIKNLIETDQPLTKREKLELQTSIDIVERGVHMVLDLAKNAQERLRESLKEQAIRKQPYVIDDLLQKCLSTISLPRNITLTKRFEATDLTIMATDELEAVFYEIIHNSIKAMPEGGTLTIVAQEVDNGIEIVFSDTGIGFKPQEKDRIFDLFYQGEHSSRFARGFGIGLYRARQVVRDLDGEILATSDGLNQGATFKVHFTV
jgi:signal transduction histidine kinase